MTKILFAVVCIAACHLAAFGVAAEPVSRDGNGGKAAKRVLYNGIALSATWPPQRDSLSFDPETPPYLVAPPDVIPIDVGRQLFVDDFLIEHTTLQRAHHQPTYDPANHLSTLRDKPVRFRFHLRDGRMYSFWVSAAASGASRGYVAAAASGFAGPTDTIGKPQPVVH